MWLSYVDESQSDRVLDPDTYLLAAALCHPDDLDAIRTTMRGMLLPGQRKLHWRAESNKRRRQIVEAISAAPVEHLVVVRGGRAGEKPERRRRACLERLLFELPGLGVDQVVMESRGRKDDERDREMLRAMRTRKLVGGSLRLDHTPGPSEELLWLPDAVCGAVTRSRSGDRVYVQAIEARLTILTINI